MYNLFQDDLKENGRKKKHNGHLFRAAKLIDFDSESNGSSDLTADETTQVFGPTTRRKWTEWTSKPPLSDSATERQEHVSQTMTVFVTFCLVVACIFSL